MDKFVDPKLHAGNKQKHKVMVDVGADAWFGFGVWVGALTVEG